MALRPKPAGARAIGVHWVQPRLVGTVEYREYVRALRHPSWRGLRVEIDPVTVGLPD
ncbi:ATP dependent DNA ligase [Nocardia xishanensis]